MNKITNSGKAFPKMNLAGKTLKRINPKTISKLLGAEMVSTSSASSEKAGSPVSLFALRQYLLKNLHSSGGRPAIEKKARRQKSPISEETWAAITTLTNILRAEGISVSPGQMANAIIQQGLAQLTVNPG